MEPLGKTVAKNADIVWKRTNVILSMGDANTGARQDTKERNAKVVVPLAYLEITVRTHAALSVEEIHRAIILRENAMKVVKKDGEVLFVEKERQVEHYLFFQVLLFR